MGTMVNEPCVPTMMISGVGVVMVTRRTSLRDTWMPFSRTVR